MSATLARKKGSIANGFRSNVCLVREHCQPLQESLRTTNFDRDTQKKAICQTLGNGGRIHITARIGSRRVIIDLAAGLSASLKRRAAVSENHPRAKAWTPCSNQK